MKNTTKVVNATIVGGVVGALLGIASGFPPERVLISGLTGAVVMFLILIALKFRP